MNSNLKCIIAFMSGVAIGSVATYFGVKKYFEKKADEEINREVEAVRNLYSEKEEEIKKVTNEQIEKRAYEIVASRYSTEDSAPINKEREDEVETMPAPYTIKPEEYGETGYKPVSLNYYADDVLTDENDHVITDIEHTVGQDSLTKFGEYEKDTVFVRNDNLKIDYEILADNDRYCDLYHV